MIATPFTAWAAGIIWQPRRYGALFFSSCIAITICASANFQCPRSLWDQRVLNRKGW